MKTVFLIATTLTCMFVLYACVSNNTIKPLKTEEERFDLSIAKEMVELGEKVIVDICGKETVSKDEFEKFFKAIQSIYDNQTAVHLKEVLFYNEEYENPKTLTLNIRNNVFYPTSLHRDISVVSAKVISIYYEDDVLNKTFLRIMEEYSGEDKILSDFYREYVYKKNDKGEWVFYGFNGTGNYAGESFQPNYINLK